QLGLAADTINAETQILRIPALHLGEVLFERARGQTKLNNIARAEREPRRAFLLTLDRQRIAGPARHKHVLVLRRILSAHDSNREKVVRGANRGETRAVASLQGQRRCAVTHAGRQKAARAICQFQAHRYLLLYCAAPCDPSQPCSSLQTVTVACRWSHEQTRCGTIQSPPRLGSSAGRTQSSGQEPK